MSAFFLLFLGRYWAFLSLFPLKFWHRNWLYPGEFFYYLDQGFIHEKVSTAGPTNRQGTQVLSQKDREPKGLHRQVSSLFSMWVTNSTLRTVGAGTSCHTQFALSDLWTLYLSWSPRDPIITPPQCHDSQFHYTARRGIGHHPQQIPLPFSMDFFYQDSVRNVSGINPPCSSPRVSCRQAVTLPHIRRCDWAKFGTIV